MRRVPVPYPFEVACDSSGLAIDRLFKGKVFQAEAHIVLIVGVGAAHWLPQDGDDLRLGYQFGCPLRRAWVE